MSGLPGAAANLAGGVGGLERKTGGGNGDLYEAALGVVGAFAKPLTAGVLELFARLLLGLGKEVLGNLLWLAAGFVNLSAAFLPAVTTSLYLPLMLFIAASVLSSAASPASANPEPMSFSWPTCESLPRDIE